MGHFAAFTAHPSASTDQIDLHKTFGLVAFTSYIFGGEFPSHYLLAKPVVDIFFGAISIIHSV
jgi:hypothetical protein